VENKYFVVVFPGFIPTRSGSVDWGDFDRDGDLDLLLTGESYNGPVSKIYRNNRNGNFEDIHAQLIGLYMSDGHFGDYDNDGDLDVVISGMSTNYDFISRIYRNDAAKAKAAKKEYVEQNIWNSRYYNYERTPRIYYFVYSSGFYDLDGDGIKEYHAFVSTIKKQSKQYELQQHFNAYIRKHYPKWPLIDQGNIIENGFITLKEAQESRKTIVHQYKINGFTIHTVDW
jgi:hypothetical protein